MSPRRRARSRAQNETNSRSPLSRPMASASTAAAGVPAGTAGPRERRRMRARRTPALIAIVALLIAGVVLERRGTTEASTSATAQLSSLMPTAAARGALSSTWFCAAGTARGSAAAPGTTPTTGSPGSAAPTTSTSTTTTSAASAPTATQVPGFLPPEGVAAVVAEHTVVVSNQSDRAQHARVTAYPSQGDPVIRSIDLAPHARVDVVVSDLVRSAFASAMVETDGGLVAVEHHLAGPTGRTVGPCASSASASWDFAAGTTRLGSRQIFVAFNPFPQQAVLDFSFQVEEQGGRQAKRETDRLKGVVVPPGRAVPIDITDVIPVRDQLATRIDVRGGLGRVVIDRLLVADGTGSLPKHLSVGLGAPAPATTWVFADGRPLAEGIETSFVVYNPGNETVEADVLIKADSMLAEIDPYEISIRPGQYSTVTLAQDRVPFGIGYWAAVHSRIGGPLVVERVVRAVRPAKPAGVAYTLGSPLLARDWLVPLAGAAGMGTVDISIANLSATDPAVLTVSLVADGRVTPLPAFNRVDLAAGARTLVSLADIPVGAAETRAWSLRIQASAPVVVDRFVAFDDAISLAASPAVPVRDGLVLPPSDVTTRVTQSAAAPSGPTDGTVPSVPGTVAGRVPGTVPGTAVPPASTTSTSSTSSTSSPGSPSTTAAAAPSTAGP